MQKCQHTGAMAAIPQYQCPQVLNALRWVEFGQWKIGRLERFGLLDFRHDKRLAAGVIVNLFIALIFGILIRLSAVYNFDSEPFIFITSAIVLVNLVLAVFNLMPIPPLDGSKIVFALLPNRFRMVEFFLERYSIFILIIFILFFWQKLSPIIFSLFKLFTGDSF